MQASLQISVYTIVPANPQDFWLMDQPFISQHHELCVYLCGWAALSSRKTRSEHISRTDPYSFDYDSVTDTLSLTATGVCKSKLASLTRLSDLPCARPIIITSLLPYFPRNTVGHKSTHFMLCEVTTGSVYTETQQSHEHELQMQTKRQIICYVSIGGDGFLSLWSEWVGFFASLSGGPTSILCAVVQRRVATEMMMMSDNVLMCFSCDETEALQLVDW